MATGWEGSEAILGVQDVFSGSVSVWSTTCLSSYLRVKDDTLSLCSLVSFRLSH